MEKIINMLIAMKTILRTGISSGGNKKFTYYTIPEKMQGKKN